MASHLLSTCAPCVSRAPVGRHLASRNLPSDSAFLSTAAAPFNSGWARRAQLLPGPAVVQGHRRRARPTPARAGLLDGLFGKSKGGGKSARNREAAAAVRALEELVADTERGNLGGADVRAEVEALVDTLKELQGDTPTTGSQLTGVWELLWTSEQETLFLLEKGLWRVGAAQESYQVIDTEAGSLQNVILFGDEGEGALVVDSSLEVTSDVRCQFKFSGATIRTPKRKLTLPPVGKGWFDTLYVDANLRVARDVRGDTLVVRRSALPLDAFK